MKIVKCDKFASIKNDDASTVFEIFPDVFGDSRGSFTEVLRTRESNDFPKWFCSQNWISQINRSTSIPNVIRGLHAQKGEFCQSKLVECISGFIYDIIIDARPNSESFGIAKVFELNSKKANKLFVPKGFLHGFYSMQKDSDGNDIKENIFQYYIGGGVYNKDSEINVNPKKILEYSPFKDFEIKPILSEKDLQGEDLTDFLDRVEKEYNTENKVWYY